MLSLIYFDEIKSNREFKQSCKFDERQTLLRGNFDFLQVTRYQNSTHHENILEG